MTAATKRHLLSLDECRQTGATCFIRGKLAFPENSIDQVSLIVTDPLNTCLVRIAGVISQAEPGKGDTAFVIYGALPPEVSDVAARFSLEVISRNVSAPEFLTIPRPKLSAPIDSRFSRLLQAPYLHYGRVAVRLVRQGQFAPLARKLLQGLHLLFSPVGISRRFLTRLGQQDKPLVLVIDHDLGGGANIYREQLVKELSESACPLVLTVQAGISAYQLSFQDGKSVNRCSTQDMEALFAALGQRPPVEIYLNNILSFPDPLAFLSRLTSFLADRAQEVRTVMLLHDYYCICPSWNLLDHAGTFCQIPAGDRCDSCRGKLQTQFLSLVGTVTIPEWREAWAQFLAHAAEIRTFSNSSRELFNRAFHNCDPKIVTVIPHRLPVKLRPIHLDDQGHPRVCILGNIGFSKGSELVCDLINYLDKTGSDIKIDVFGQVLNMPNSPRIFCHGPYRSDELPLLLEKYGCNLAFFPSICAETFSYVTEELIVMQIPILTFDIGAPGERVSSYPRGKVIPISSPRNIAAALTQLYTTHVRRPVGEHQC